MYSNCKGIVGLIISTPHIKAVSLQKTAIQAAPSRHDVSVCCLFVNGVRCLSAAAAAAVAVAVCMPHVSLILGSSYVGLQN